MTTDQMDVNQRLVIGMCADAIAAYHKPALGAGGETLSHGLWTVSNGHALGAEIITIGEGSSESDAWADAAGKFQAAKGEEGAGP